MEKVTKRLVSTGTWADASDLDPIDLPREGLITEVGIRANLTVTVAATAVQDATKRSFQSLKIEGDGGRTFLGLAGQQTSRLLNFLNECEMRMTGLGAEVDVGGASFNQSFIFHPGSNPRDPFDMTAVIPARALSTLQLKLTTAAALSFDGSNAITPGTFYYWVNQVLEVPVPAGIMTPLGSLLSWAEDAAYSDFSKEIDVPAGAWLRRIIMLVQDETGTVPVRVDDAVEGVRLRMPVTATQQLELLWEDMKVMTAKRYGLRYWMQEKALGAIATTRPGYNGAMILPAGLAIIDLRDYFHPLYGANLTNYRTGDVKLGLSVATPGSGEDVLIYWDQLKPVDPIYVGK